MLLIKKWAEICGLDPEVIVCRDYITKWRKIDPEQMEAYRLRDAGTLTDDYRNWMPVQIIAPIPGVNKVTTVQYMNVNMQDDYYGYRVSATWRDGVMYTACIYRVPARIWHEDIEELLLCDPTADSTSNTICKSMLPFMRVAPARAVTHKLYKPRVFGETLGGTTGTTARSGLNPRRSLDNNEPTVKWTRNRPPTPPPFPRFPRQITRADRKLPPITEMAPMVDQRYDH